MHRLTFAFLLELGGESLISVFVHCIHVQSAYYVQFRPLRRRKIRDVLGEQKTTRECVGRGDAALGRFAG